MSPRLCQGEEQMFGTAPVTGCYDPAVGIVDHQERFHSIEWKIIQEYEHHFRVYEPAFRTPTLLMADLTSVHIDTPGLLGTMDFQSLFTSISIFRLCYWYHHIPNDIQWRLITIVSTFYVNPQFSGTRSIHKSYLELWNYHNHSRRMSFFCNELWITRY